MYPARDKAIRDIASWTELEHGHTRLHSPLSHRHFWARPRRNSTQNKQPETRPSPPAHKIPNSPRLLPWMNQRNTITVRGRHPGIDVVGRGFRDTDSGTIGQHAGRGRHQDKESLLETDLA